jgi:hypothetical protein
MKPTNYVHDQYNSFSTAFFTAVIWLVSSFDSPVVILAAMTALETLHARPRAALDGRKM